MSPVSTAIVTEPLVMSSLPRLSSSVNSSSDSSPRTADISASPFVRSDILFPSPHKSNHKEAEEGMLGKRVEAVLHTPPPSSPLRGISISSTRKRALEAQSLMESKYHPYKRRAVPPPLELRFTARTMGRSSHTEMSIEDVREVSHPIRT